jgi:hypothetical protein
MSASKRSSTRSRIRYRRLSEDFWNASTETPRGALTGAGDTIEAAQVALEKQLDALDHGWAPALKRMLSAAAPHRHDAGR